MPRKLPIADCVALVFAGLAIGWIAGLSTSAVASTIIAGILALAGAVISVLSGSESHRAKPINGEDNEMAGGTRAIANRVTAVPVGLLAIAIAFGAPVGIIARSHQWFGSASGFDADPKSKQVDVGNLYGTKGIGFDDIQSLETPEQILAELSGIPDPRMQSFVRSLAGKKDLTAADTLKAVAKELIVHD